MGFEPTRAEPNGLAVHRLNHSATSSLAHVVTSVHFGLVKSKFLWILTFQKTYLFVWIVGCHWMIGVTACLVTVFYQHQWFSGRMLACHAGGPGSIPGWCNFLYIFILTFFCIFHSLNWLRFSISRYVFNKSLKKVRSEQKKCIYLILVIGESKFTARVPSTLDHSTETALDVEFQDALGGCMIDRYS